MSSIPSTGCSLALHTVASSIVRVTAQRPQRIRFLPHRARVGASHGAQSGGSCSVFFTRMVREMTAAVAQSSRRPFASCVVGRERAARFSPAEGYHALTKGRRAAFTAVSAERFLSDHDRSVRFNLA